MKLFLQDSTFAHCLFSNNPLTPIQFSEDIIWDKSKNFTENDFVVYTDNFLHCARNNNKKDIAWLIEPEELFPQTYQYIRQNYNKFFKIFTHDKDLLSLPNVILIPYGGCWIKKEDFDIHHKTKNLSIICSSKNYLTGHKLRHKFINKYNSICDVYGNGYKQVLNKIEALKDYRYQVVFENTKKDFWFTEKIIDCFVTGTIPIYYGCNGIDKFFDMNSIIKINSLDDFDQIKNELNESLYLNKTNSIKNNFNEAKNYLLAEKSVSRFLKYY